jgi:hypothetical protein
VQLLIKIKIEIIMFVNVLEIISCGMKVHWHENSRRIVLGSIGGRVAMLEPMRL